MRGRLINRATIRLYRLDATASDAVVGGGYDDDLRCLLPVDDNTQLGTSSRVEQAPVDLPCQVGRRAWGAATPRGSGYEIDYDLEFVLFIPDLEAAGLMDANGTPEITNGDRVGALLRTDGTVEETFDNPPGLFVVRVERCEPAIAAFGTPRSNLVILFCKYAAQVRASGGT
jgi:hypothetical protein